MYWGSREGVFACGIRSGRTGLMLAILALSGMAGKAPVAMAAGDGKSAELANELRALSATNSQAALQSRPATTKKTRANSGKKAVAKATLSSKRKSRSAAAKPARKRKDGTKVVSASAFVVGPSIRKTLIKKGGSLNGRVNWNAPSGCVPAALKSVLYQVSQKFGPVVVNSSIRGRRHNRRVGGAQNSWHLRCMAVDFRVHGSHKGLWAFLRSHPAVGGLKRYPLGFLHIDLGPKRTW